MTETETQSTRRPGQALIAALVVAVVTAATFASIADFNFVSMDDRLNVFQNPHLIPPITGQNIAYFWSHAYYELYMPLTYSLWAICAWIGTTTTPIVIPGGDTTHVNPAVFHSASLLLHTANSVLVFVLLRRLLPDTKAEDQRSIWAAALGALLFALHPLQVESVAWTTGTNNLLSGIFEILALLLYMDYAKQNDTVWFKNARFWFATLFYLLALLSKPSAAATPLLAAAIDSGILRRRPARWLPPLALWAVLAAGCAVITHFSQDVIPPNVPLWARPFVAGDALAYYMGKLVFPISLTPNPARAVKLVMSSWWGYTTWLLPAAIALILVRAGEKARYLWIAFVIFVVALLPMLGFVPFYATKMTTVAEHYVYLALIGPALALAWLLSRPLPKSTAMIAAGTALAALTLLEIRTVTRLPIWRDSFTLSAAGLETNPDDPKFLTNVAIDEAAHGKIPEAIQHLRTAVKSDPDVPLYSLLLGSALEDSGDPAGAIPPLQNAVKLAPNNPEAQSRLGIALARTGRAADAITPLRAALALQPQDVSTRYILGVVLANLKRDSEAEKELEQVIAVNPDFPGAREALAQVQARAGNAKP